MEDDMQEKVTDKEISMTDYMIENLDFLIRAVDKKWDGILLIDGVEGSGKTTFGCQVSYYEAWKCGSSFTLENVVFTAEQFEHAVISLPSKSVILWDEAIFGAWATEWATLINRTIVKLMVTIRKKQLFINIIIPWIYMLQPYMAVARTRALLHVTTPDGISRGYYRFYDYPSKQMLYFKNKRFYTYFNAKTAFHGYFKSTHGLFFDEKEYDLKKDTAIKELIQKSEKPKAKDNEIERMATKKKRDKDE